jgi:hypothetical protein
MGTQVTATCPCGLTEDILIGGGMETFRTICCFPCLCEGCHSVVEVNLLARGKRCPNCKSRKVTPYDDPRLSESPGGATVVEWGIATGVTITKYTGSGGEVTVPDTTNGLPVTGIGDSAFRDCTTLTSITIGTNVTRMGEFAFYRSTSLTNATIPNGVTNIGYGSFGYCTRLAFVPIPDSVTSIGDYAFQYCSSLSAIAVGMSNLVYSSPGGMLYDKIQTRLIQCPGGKAGEAAIPATVTNISSDAFRGCTSLSEIIVDASNLTYCSLGGVLFDKSHSTLIQYPPGRTGAYTVPDGVTTIGDRSLYYCPNLTSLILPEGVTNIGIAAVYDCYQPAPAPPANP